MLSISEPRHSLEEVYLALVRDGEEGRTPVSTPARLSRRRVRGMYGKP